MNRSRVSMGIIGTVLTVALVLSALQIDRLPIVSQVSRYDVYFDDAGGLAVGNDVSVAGVNVGKVEKISLDKTRDGLKAKVRFRINDTIEMGDRTRAAIKTETVLGRRNLSLTPIGDGRLALGGVIPVDQTTSPYSLTDMLDDSVSTLAKTDTGQLDDALDTLSDAFSKTPPNVKAAVDGIGDLSKTIADRDNALNDLLDRARGVTDIIGGRSKQIQQMLVDANALMGELQTRRAAIAQLITGTRDVSAELSGFVDDNDAQLTPVLDKFNRVLDILNDNEKNFSDAIDNLGPYANILGEAVSNGPYFSSLVGLPTWGDYMGTFLRILQQKYPEAARYFLDYGGFPLAPNAWSQAPNADAPDVARPTPSHSPPTPQTSTPKTSTGPATRVPGGEG
ncbi:MAG: MCE family protein [Gordonia sp. (in: high G+C Gram-positive bacteria)]|uniref:MCE family protein n=1 Tax=Gordonia sp. (in: high G+C Gram-positive bacteria) TaxID=84139 RepID=UPI0039E5B33B